MASSAASTASDRRSRSGNAPKAVLPMPITATDLIYTKTTSMLRQSCTFWNASRLSLVGEWNARILALRISPMNPGYFPRISM